MSGPAVSTPCSSRPTTPSRRATGAWRAPDRGVALGRGSVELASRLRSYDRTAIPPASVTSGSRGPGRRPAAPTLSSDAGRAAPARGRPTMPTTVAGLARPTITAALGILICSPKRRSRPSSGKAWADGHAAAERAIRAADLVLALTEVDLACLAPLVVPRPSCASCGRSSMRRRIGAARAERQRHRGALARRFGLDPQQPWLLAVAMMRADAKRESYEPGRRLGQLSAVPWQLLVVGDGSARPAVEAMLRALGEDRVRFAGLIPENALPPVHTYRRTSTSTAAARGVRHCPARGPGRGCTRGRRT